MLSRAMGTYELDEPLGSSALGTTYLGRRKEMRVAVKVLEIATNATDQERQQVTREFQRRAQVVSELFHPGIVPLRDYGVAPPFLYAVSGFQIARSLADQRRLGTVTLPLPREVIIAWISQLGEALREAHRVGVAHGNLKPTNIFVGEQDGDQAQLLIGDFALVSEQTAALAPTPGARHNWDYMAPEQRDAAPGKAADQFSLAAIAYEWLTGQLPFAHDAPDERNGAPLAIVTLMPTLATYVAIDDVFRRALAADPEARYGSIGAFVRALESALTTGQTAGPPVDVNSTRPAAGNAATLIKPTTVPDDIVPPMPNLQLSVPRQQDPSAWLVAGPTLDKQLDSPPPLAMLSSEELYAVAPPGGRRQGKKKQDARRFPNESDSNEGHKPTTREQELMAPAAPRHIQAPKPPRSARAARHSAPPPQEETVFDQFNIPLPRREVLARLGKGALIVGVGVGAVAGIATAWEHFGGALLGAAHRQPPSSIRLAPPTSFAGHTGAVQALAWTPDGSRLASGAAGDAMIRLWDVTKPPAPLATITDPAMAQGITALSWARDSRTLLVGIAGAPAQIWNAGQGTLISHVPYPVEVAQWHPQQDILALVSWTAPAKEAASGTAILLWDITTAQLVATLTGHNDKIAAVKWSALGNGFLLASGGKDQQIIVWTGTAASSITPLASPLKGHTGTVAALDWSAQDERLISGGADGSARLWDINQHSDTRLLQTSGTIGAAAWSPREALLAFGDDAGNVTLWDADNHAHLATLTVGGAVVALTWSPDAHYLAAGTSDHLIHVWNTANV